MRRNLLCLVVITLLLSACAPALVSHTQAANAADVKTKWFEERFGYWDRITILSVDDRFVGSIYEGGSVRVDPGPHTFVVYMKFNRGLGTGPFEAQRALKVVLAPYQKYALNGEVSGGEVNLWIEDVSTHERAGEAVLAAWRIAPREAGVVPVFIPAKR